MPKKPLAATAGALLLITTVLTAAAQELHSVSFKGNVISRDIRVIDGRPYIPLADAARALGGSVVKSGTDYEIQAAGGANEVKGLSGTVGQMLFTGKWRFEVLDVKTADHYDSHYQPDSYTWTPSGANDELVVIDCLVKNAQTVPDSPLLRHENAMDTAVTDANGSAYPPIDFDLIGGGGYGPPSMLPGSSSTFAAIFDVPKGTNLKDLVFSLANLEQRDNPTNVRISIAQR